MMHKLVQRGAMMQVQVGEVYGKQNAGKFSMYNVIKVQREVVTLQNIDNPLSQFETTLSKLSQAGYLRISQKPFVDLNANTPKRKKAVKKPTRCPLTLDFIEQRADSERPAPIIDNLFV
jgi:hypothetical protein